MAGSLKPQFLALDDNGFSSNSQLGLKWSAKDCSFFPGGGLFASVSQMGGNDNGGFGLPNADLLVKYVTLPEGLKNLGITDEEKELEGKKSRKGLNLKIKVKNHSLRRLISGGVAGAISRTCVAPLETIRTHLMVGSSGNSTMEVFNSIMKVEGWPGLFRGNFINVIRVTPSKAIELFVYDTVNKNLSSRPGEQVKLPVPASLIAGACAGVTSTLITYPLELVKTRLTIQRGVYDSMVDAFVKILKEGGVGELYRGLTPSILGVVPYAATNYCAYDTLRKFYKKITKAEKIGNIETLLIGSIAGAISGTATFPLEVARKHMQVGAVSGRQVYKNMLHALSSILAKEGMEGLYKGLGPSCLKLVPAAGISFMCYEACKKILVENEGEE